MTGGTPRKRRPRAERQRAKAERERRHQARLEAQRTQGSLFTAHEGMPNVIPLHREDP